MATERRVNGWKPRPLDVNYDESAVPPFTVPDPLVCFDGSRVRDSATWFDKRRPELLEVFSSQVYGRVPDPPPIVRLVRREESQVYGGWAKRVELCLDVAAPSGSRAAEPRTLNVQLWAPARAERSAVFLGLNFFGNQSVHPDPALPLARGWVPNNAEHGLFDNVASAASRGCHSDRWPIEMILCRGYAVATLYAGDAIPDYEDAFGVGVPALCYAPEQKRPRADEWGAIAVWSWALRSVVRFLAAEPNIDARRICLVGHSRFGKAALWASALDQTVAAVFASGSGCAGASLSRRRFGEQIHHLNSRFPHWFCQNFARYDQREHELPVDQHELLALIAPRPVYIGCRADDLWADTYGEFLACKHADPVYRLLAGEGLACDAPPPLDAPAHGRISYHLRPGDHGVAAPEWWHYLDFADRFLPASGIGTR